MLIISAGLYATAMLMVSVFVFGCRKSPPDWVFMIAFIGYPVPLIIASAVMPYLYIKKQKIIWTIITAVLAIFLSCIIFLIFFLVLTQYC
ncbi:MAG: hypothetical protein ABI528_07930 [bacterium]